MNDVRERYTMWIPSSSQSLGEEKFGGRRTAQQVFSFRPVTSSHQYGRPVAVVATKSPSPHQFLEGRGMGVGWRYMYM